ncbi:MAG: universal stress protein [Proteobacteria bacterium]|nr:universal stress protein [Pseudomonadota bacterium]MBU1737870.1 universal stress protein [Pseudomonadota bacterium]
MGKIQNFLKELEKTMAAAAFAEAGEHETARQLLQDFKTAHKKVLLGTDHLEPDLKIVNYALNLCERMGGGLEIFHVVPPTFCARKNKTVSPLESDPAFAAFNEKMASLGVAYQPVCSDRGLVREILDYVAERRQVMCVVVSPSHADETSLPKRDGRSIGEWFQDLSCPVLVYSGYQKA